MLPSQKELLQKERRKLENSRKKNRQARTDAVRTEMQESRIAARQRASRQQGNAVEALLRTAKNLCETVASTWGVQIPVRFTTSNYNGHLSAYTDFKSITIQYPMLRDAVVPISNEHDEVVAFDYNEDKIKKMVREVKALMYHETGHIRFTAPYAHMVVATSTTPQGRAWGEAGHDLMSLHYFWNALEDQRMEAAVVQDSPDIANYFTELVLNRLYTPTPEVHLLVAGRKYLPSSVRDSAFAVFANKYGVPTASRVVQIIDRYLAATTLADMGVQVVELGKLLHDSGMQLPSQTGQHHQMSSGRASNEAGMDTERSATKQAQGDQGDQGDQAQGDQAQGDQAQGDQGDQGQGQAQDDQDGAGGGAGDGTAVSEQDIRDEQDNLRKSVKEALHEALECLEESASVKGVLQEARDLMEQYGDSDRAKRYAESGGSTTTITGHELAEAHRLSTLMEEALTTASVALEPMWRSRSERGVIDPFAYRMREPGSRDFHRSFDDPGDLSNMLSVSLLLDRSGSMSHHAGELSMAAFAVAQACYSLDIPCTTTVWSDGYEVLTLSEDGTPPEPYSISASGGTNPSGALMDMARHFPEATQHLVVVFTDGVWDNSGDGLRVLRNSTAPNRTIILVGFNLPKHTLDKFRAEPFQDVLPISSLNELPIVVQNTIANIIQV